MQMRRVRGRIAARPDVPDHSPLLDVQPLGEVVRIALEVRVVIDALLFLVELIDRDAARTTVEELADRAVDCCDDRRAARREDVERSVETPSASRLLEVVPQLIGADPLHRNVERAR